MAQITKLAQVLAGVVQNISLTSDEFAFGSVRLGGGSGTLLTKALLDRLLKLQDGSDLDDGYHTHDGRYYTETELGSATGTTGSDLIGDDNTYSFFTPAAATLKGALSGIDTALGASGNSANRSLSNLTSPTSVNQDLIPSATTKNLGTAATYWNKLYVNLVHDTSDTIVADFFSRQLKSGATVKLDWSGTDVSLNTRKLTNVTDPTSSQDAATKNYVDIVALGFSAKKAVRVASVANVNLSNGLENGDTVDGVVLVTGDRVLLKDQTDATANGIYVVVASGASSRATDFDSLSPIDEINRAYVPVQEGTQAGHLYVQYGTVSTVGSDPINFTYWNPLIGLIGGDMITTDGYGLISVDLATVSGLESTTGDNTGELRIKTDTATANTIGVTITSNGAGTKVDANSFTDGGSETLALASGVAGAGLALTSGVLSVNVDDATLEINTDTLRIKDAGVTLAKLASNSVDENKLTTSVAGDGLTGGGGSPLAVGAGTGLSVAANAVNVDYAPQSKKTMIAGESFAANTSFLVRWAVNGETAGRVYKADSAAATTDFKFWVHGVALSTGAVSAGQNIDVTLLGTHTLGSSDTPFGGTDIGKAVWLTTAGAFSVTAPTTDASATVKIGTVETTTKAFIQGLQLTGVN